MAKKNSVLIRVSSSFDTSLRKEHDKFNREVAQKYFKKDITFTDFTDMLSGKISMKDLSNKYGKREKHNWFDKIQF